MAIKKKVGRPTVFTPEAILKLEQAFAIDATVTEACSYADVSLNAFYEHLKTHPEFQERIDRLRDKPILKARQTIVQGLDDPENSKWYLERKRKKEFSTRQELTGEDGRDLIVAPEEKKKIDDIFNENGKKTGKS